MAVSTGILIHYGRVEHSRVTIPDAPSTFLNSIVPVAGLIALALLLAGDSLAGVRANSQMRPFRVHAAVFFLSHTAGLGSTLVRYLRWNTTIGCYRGDGKKAGFDLDQAARKIDHPDPTLHKYVIDDTKNAQPRGQSGSAGDGILQTVLKDIASAKLATAVGSIIVLTCILGTLLPQDTDVQKHTQTNPDSVGMMTFLGSLGLTNVFDAWWFIVLLIFFSLNVSACLTRRMSALAKSGRLGVPGWGFLLTHLSVLMILAGAVIRAFAGQKGYLEMQEGQSSSHFLTSDGPVKLPFEVRLVNFDIEYYTEKSPETNTTEADMLTLDWPDRHIWTQIVVRVGAPAVIHPADEEPTESNAFQIVVSRYVPDFVIDMTTREVSTRSQEPRNPAIHVSVENRALQIARWIFANHPEFDMLHSSTDKKTEGNLAMRYQSSSGARLSAAKELSKRIKSFKSSLQIVENRKVVKAKTIEVNSPLGYRGYVLYQSGYNPEDLTWSTMQVVRDPGVPVVYAGFTSMVAGLVLLLILKPAGRKPEPATQPPDNGGQPS